MSETLPGRGITLWDKVIGGLRNLLAIFLLPECASQTGPECEVLPISEGAPLLEKQLDSWFHLNDLGVA